MNMKRVFALNTIAILILSFAIISVSAAPSDIITDTIGLETKDIPQTTEQLKEEYLKQNWEQLIVKNAILGKVHLFFNKISFLFRILFGQPYSISPQLLFIILLWIYVVSKISSALFAFNLFNRPAQIAISVGSGIILAQTQIFAKIISALSKLIFSPESWLMRIVVIAITVIVLFMIHFGIGMLNKAIKKSKEEGKKLSMQHVTDEMREFMQGVKEGQSLEK